MFAKLGFGLLNVAIILYLIFGPEPTIDEIGLQAEAPGVSENTRDRHDDLRDLRSYAYTELLDLEDGSSVSQSKRYDWLLNVNFADNLYVNNGQVFFTADQYERTVFSFQTAKRVAYVYAKYKYPDEFDGTLYIYLTDNFTGDERMRYYRGDDLR